MQTPRLPCVMLRVAVVTRYGSTTEPLILAISSSSALLYSEDLEEGEEGDEEGEEGDEGGEGE